MGEIADMVLNGDLDCETGEYLGEGMGFPRTANDPSVKSILDPVKVARKARSHYRRRVRKLFRRENIPDAKWPSTAMLNAFYEEGKRPRQCFDAWILILQQETEA